MKAITRVVAAVCIVILSLCVLEAQPLMSCNAQDWAMYKKKFGKYYSHNATLDNLRYSYYCVNQYKITSHNLNSETSYWMGLNHLSDYFPEEIYKFFGDPSKAYEPTEVARSSYDMYEGIYLNQLIDVNREPPLEVDWSLDLQRVTPIRNQGVCGSCWAFATVAMLEGQQYRFGRSWHHLIGLSEQELIDCDDTNNGCDGGSSFNALQKIRVMGGLSSRHDYPYVSGVDGLKRQCNSSTKETQLQGANIGKIIRLTPGNETLLEQVVAQYGPVAVSINVPYEFLQYQGGVFHSFECGNKPNHMVAIVGYGTDKQTGLQYWKVKNSYGIAWGLKGYGLMSRNRANNCHIASEAFIAMPPNITLFKFDMWGKLGKF